MQPSDRHHLLHGKNIPIWIETAPSSPYHHLSETVEVDAAIAGGGIVGITAAYLLKQRGFTVAILEKDAVLNGVTGHTTAKLTSQHGLIYRYLLDAFGEDSALAYGRANQEAIDTIESLVEDHGIDCDFFRTQSYVYSRIGKQADRLRQEAEAARELGLPAEFVDDVPLPFDTAGGVKFENQAQFHPLRYLRVLSDSIPGDGSHVFEHTRVEKAQEGNPCVIKTNRGIVRAGHLVIATHFPVMDRNLLFSQMEARRSYVLAARTGGGAPPGMFYEAGGSEHSLRPYSSSEKDVIIAGGGAHKTGQERPDAVAYFLRLEDHIRRHFDVKDILHRWSTQDNSTVDKIPYVGRQKAGSKILLATGFNGWGMTGGTVAASLLADLIEGRHNSLAALFDPGRFKFRVSTKKFVKYNANVGVQYAKRFLSLAHRQKLDCGQVEVISSGARKIGIFRDESGETTSVVLTCTHLGCRLHWNDAERSWDCPCHGSRFDYKGSVIQAPAIRDLKRAGPSKKRDHRVTEDNSVDSKNLPNGKSWKKEIGKRRQIMPYRTNKELPDSVKSNLPGGA